MRGGGGGGGNVFAVYDGDDVRERDVGLEGEVRGSRTDASQPGLTLAQLSVWRSAGRC